MVISDYLEHIHQYHRTFMRIRIPMVLSYQCMIISYIWRLYLANGNTDYWWFNCNYMYIYIYLIGIVISNMIIIESLPCFKLHLITIYLFNPHITHINPYYHHLWFIAIVPTRWSPRWMAKLVQITSISLWLMVPK